MIKRILTTAAAALALGGSLLATAGTAQAATHGEYPTRGYARTCHAYAWWNFSDAPASKPVRRLARDVTRLGTSLPDQVLRADVSALLVSMVAHTDGSRLAAVVAHDCHLPA